MGTKEFRESLSMQQTNRWENWWHILKEAIFLQLIVLAIASTISGLRGWTWDQFGALVLGLAIAVGAIIFFWDRAGTPKAYVQKPQRLRMARFDPDSVTDVAKRVKNRDGKDQSVSLMLFISLLINLL